MIVSSTFSRIIKFLSQSEGSFKKRLLRSSIFVVLSTVIVNLLTLIRQIVLARLLFPEAFGLMSTCAIVLRGIDILTELGVTPALIHRQQGFESAKETAFFMNVMRGVILAVVMFLTAPLVADFYNETQLNILIRVISLALLLDGFRNVNTVGLQKNLDFKKITIIQLLVSVMSTIVIIVLAWYFRSVWALVLGRVFTAFINLVSSYTIVPGRITFRFKREIAGELFRYGKFITGLAIILFIATELDNVVIGKILGMETLGFYVIAFLLSNLSVNSISKAVSKFMFPAYAELQNQAKTLHNIYLLEIKLTTALTIPAAFGLMILAPEIIGLVYGEMWMPAVAPLRILAFFGACRSIASTNGFLLNGIGRPDINFYTALLRFLSLPILLIFCTYQWELVGAASAVLITLIIQMSLGLLAVCRLTETKLIEVISSIVKWAVFSSIMACILFVIKTSVEVTIPVLIFLILLGIGLYALFAGRELLSLIKHAREIS